jgi:hypothetical protein
MEHETIFLIIMGVLCVLAGLGGALLMHYALKGPKR